jgi:hypothetical protein
MNECQIFAAPEPWYCIVPAFSPVSVESLPSLLTTSTVFTDSFALRSVMRLNLFVFISLSSYAFAAPVRLSPRDTSVVDRAISNAQISLTKLATTVQFYARRPNDNSNAQQIQIDEDTQAATDSLLRGADQMKRGPMVTFAESTRVVAEINSLVLQLERTVNSWILARGIIVSAGGQRPVWESLRRQQSAGVEFAKALIAKMPASSLAGAMYTTIVQAAYDKGIKAFS